MTPGSALAAILSGARAVQHLDGPAAAAEVFEAHRILSALVESADAVVEQAERQGDNLYCVPVETMDALSAALTRAGGA